MKKFEKGVPYSEKLPIGFILITISFLVAGSGFEDMHHSRDLINLLGECPDFFELTALEFAEILCFLQGVLGTIGTIYGGYLMVKGLSEEG